MGRAQSAGRRTAGAGAGPERAGVVPVSCFSSVDESAHYGFSVCMLLSQYRDELGDFFDSADASGGPRPRTAIANPPYIPAPDRDILMPELWGGPRGNDLVLQLLKAGYEHVVTAVPSYS